jgi:hypothetical protein
MSQMVGNFLQVAYLPTGANNYLPEGISYPLDQLAEGI